MVEQRMLFRHEVQGATNGNGVRSLIYVVR
jgi:hypothetical protein